MISKYRSQALIGDGCHLVTSDSQIFGLNKHLQSFNHTISNQQLCDHKCYPNCWQQGNYHSSIFGQTIRPKMCKGGALMRGKSSNDNNTTTKIFNVWIPHWRRGLGCHDVGMQFWQGKLLYVTNDNNTSVYYDHDYILLAAHFILWPLTI